MEFKSGLIAVFVVCLMASTAGAENADNSTAQQNKVDGWSGEVAPVNAHQGLNLDPAQTEAVDSVSKYFADIKYLQGRFVQIGADEKRMRGKFYVNRPGRFRFDYARPSRQVIISDGRFLAIQDLDLNNEDRVELDQTPFRLLLRKDVDLLRDAKISEVQQGNGQIVVGLQDKDPDAPGKITLVLSTEPDLKLKEWVTVDAQGLETRVQVSDLVKPDELDQKLFKIQKLGKHWATP